MKTTTKIIGLFLIGIGLFSFTSLAVRPITLESIRNTFLTSLFDTYIQEGEDTTIFFMVKDYDEKLVKTYAKSKCGESPIFIARAFWEGLDTTYAGYGTEVVTRCKTLFGQGIIKSELKMAAKDGDEYQTWSQYDGMGLNAAFSKLYQKPTGKFQGTGLQKLYNLSMKNYVRDMTNVIVKVMSNKPAFEAQAKLYMLKASTDPEFDGRSFGYEATEKLKADFSQDCLGDYGSRVVGTMLRRQCDGTLPVLLVCLKTVLKDYDPEYYNKVALKF